MIIVSIIIISRNTITSNHILCRLKIFFYLNYWLGLHIDSTDIVHKAYIYVQKVMNIKIMNNHKNYILFFIDYEFKGIKYIGSLEYYIIYSQSHKLSIGIYFYDYFVFKANSR